MNHQHSVLKRIILPVLLISLTAALAVTLTGCAELLAAWRSGSAGTTSAADGSKPSGSSDDTSKTTLTNGGAITADPTDTRYTWRGTITQVESGGRAFLAAVDQDYQKMLGDKAHVGLYADARVVRDDTGAAMKLADAPVGSQVIVTITGGIRESYPVQVSATEVRVIMK